MATGKRGPRTSYTVYRLEFAPKGKNPQDPETKWVVLGVLESSADAKVMASALSDCKEYDGCHFSIVKEKRDIEVKPKTNREVL